MSEKLRFKYDRVKRIWRPTPLSLRLYRVMTFWRGITDLQRGRWYIRQWSKS